MGKQIVIGYANIFRFKGGRVITTGSISNDFKDPEAAIKELKEKHSPRNSEKNSGYYYWVEETNTNDLSRHPHIPDRTILRP